MDNCEAKKYESKQYLLTNVRNDDKWFMISTINRLSSCESQLEFSETMVWEWFPKTNKRGECIGGFSGYAGGYANHFLCAQLLLKEGSLDGYNDEPEEGLDV